VRTTNAGMNIAHGDHHGPSMVWVALVDEGKRPGDSGNVSQRQGMGNEGNCCGRSQKADSTG
jgi:hypothetical protein